MDRIVSDGGEAAFVATDVRDEEAVTGAIADAIGRWGRLDILVNDAAVMFPGRDDLLKLELSLWDEIFAVNVRSVFLGMKHAVPQMIEQGGGAIISLASVGALSGAGGSTAYGATKAAIVKLTMGAAARYAKHNIRVNAIAPGIIRTRLGPQPLEGMSEAEHDALLARWQPLPRSGRPEDIGNAALFLASDESAFITGQTLTVDGGLIMAGWGGRMAEGFERET